jgi:hypothetical protein
MGIWYNEKEEEMLSDGSSPYNNTASVMETARQVSEKQRLDRVERALEKVTERLEQLEHLRKG